MLSKSLIKSTHFGMAAVMGLALAGCYTGPADQADGSGSAGGDAGGTEGAGDGSGSGDDDGSGGGDANSDGGPAQPPPTCLPGAVGCECLDGLCEGLSTCEDNVCIPGPPIPEVDGNGTAIAGLAIMLSGDIDDDENIAGYEQLEWSQVEGPDVTIDYAVGADAVAYLPVDAETGMEFVFRLSATLGDVITSADYTVTIVGADASGPMDEAKDVIALAGATFAPRGNNDYWIGSATGMFTRVDDNAVSASYDLLSPIADIAGYPGGIVLVAQPELQTLTGFNSNNNLATPFLTQLSGGSPLGSVSGLAVDGDDNIYIGTAEGTILFYNSPDGAEPATTTVMETLTTTPTALALGDVPVPPDADENDEGNVLYIGGSDGNVWQIGLSAAEVPSDVVLGSATLYLSVPGSGPVTGLALDDVGNMWVGKSSGLYLVRRAFDSEPSVVRTLSPTAGLGNFNGLRADDNQIVWIDSSSGRVGSVITTQ